MKPTFAIITTTYKRPEHIMHALASVQGQTYANWQHIIVVDDPVSDYSPLQEKAASEPRATVIHNDTNIGKNASVNKAFTHLREQQFAGYVIFLDDDDWLAPDCLTTFATMIENSPHTGWYVTNRTNVDENLPFTQNKTGRASISYLYDVLMRHRFTGDTTHCLNFQATAHITFPTPIKNAEEWLYFAQVTSVYPRFLYQEAAGTYSHGYSEHGLTDLYHKQQEQKRNACTLLTLVWQRRLFHPIILLYVTYRLIRSYR